MEKRKKTLLILGLCIFTLALVGLSYAFWVITLQQTGENDIATACLNIEILYEQDTILLNPAYPILDEEGEALTPYKFTIHNKCQDNLKYQINVEVMNATTLASKYIKVKLNEESKSGTITNLTEENKVKQTLEDAKEAYKLRTGYLESEASKAFEFREWMDEKTEGTDKESMNKTFISKITITATYIKEIPKTLEETILALPIENKDDEDPGTTGLYKVTHENANITYTNDLTSKNNLQKDEYRYAGSEPNNYVDFGETFTTDTYGFFNQEKYNFYSKEKCEADRKEFLEDYSNTGEITECTSTSNTEGLYLLEYEYLEDSYFNTLSFSNEDECQSEKEYYELPKYSIVQDCSQPENIYSYTYTESRYSIEYFSNEECLSDNEYDIAEGYGICKKSHEAGEPLYWRIIGLVNTPEGQRVKLVRDKSIGHYVWDTSSEDEAEGSGVNEWSQSDLMKLLNPGYETNKDQICTYDYTENENYKIICDEEKKLVNNSLYWNGEEGQCYTDDYNSTSPCSFTNLKMPSNLKNMIEDVTWNTGADDGNFESEGAVLKFYEYERSSNIGDICESDDYCDNVPRTTSWKGKVGLIYSSDYGYATSGGSTTNRTSCLNEKLYDWANVSDCVNNDWLRSNFWDWILSPSLRGNAFNALYDGTVDDTILTNPLDVRPSVYLKPDVFVKQGDGSLDNPYILEK